METLKALLQLQLTIGILMLSIGFGNTCMSKSLTPIPSTGYNLPYVNVKKEEEDFALSLVKKYKIVWNKGKRKIAIKYKKKL